MKKNRFGASATLVGWGGKLLVLFLVLAIVFGNGLSSLLFAEDDPEIKAALLSLNPNIRLKDKDNSGNVDVGVAYTGLFDCSSSFVDDFKLENVVFTIESDANITLSALPGNHEGYTTEVIGPQMLKITVKEISGSGSAVAYGSFNYVVNNRVTPDQLECWAEITSVECDGVILTQDDWKDETNIMMVSVIANAENVWSCGGITSYYTNYTYQLTQGDSLASGTNHVLPVAANANAPYVTLSAYMSNRVGTSPPYTRHADTVALEFGAYIQMTGGLVIDPSLIGTGKLTTGDWARVDGADALGDLFKKYFSITGVDGFSISAKLADDYLMSNKILLKFERSDTGVKDIVSVQPSFTMKNFYFREAISNTKMIGNVTFVYLKGAVSYQYYDGTDVVNKVYPIPAGSTTREITAQISPAIAPQQAADTFVEGLNKQYLPWQYSLTDQGDNLGNAGEITRTYVSPGKSVPYDDGAGNITNVPMDRIWFRWNLGGTSLPVGIGEVRIDDGSGTNYDPNEMIPIGFEIPAVGSGTKGEVYVDWNGSDKLVWDGETLDSWALAQGFAASPDNPNVILIGDAGKNVYGISFVYTPTATGNISFTGDAKILFQVQKLEPLLDEQGNPTGEKRLFNESSVTVKGNSNNTLASGTVDGGDVLYVADFSDTIRGNKDYENLDKGDKSDTTTGDRLRYTLVISDLTNTHIGSTSVARGMWVHDENDGYLNIDDSSIIVTIERKVSSSTIAPTGTNIKKDVDPVTGIETYTGVTVHRTGYGITDGEVEMVLVFEGNFITGDKITITYEATVKDGIPTAQKDAINNKAEAFLYEYPYDGTQPYSWEGKYLIGEVGIGVRSQVPFGDICIIPTTEAVETLAEANNKTRTLFYTGDLVNLYVLGGQIKSYTVLNQPAYLIALPDNLMLTGAVAPEGTLFSISASAAGRTMEKDGSVGNPSSVTYFDKDGNEIITPDTPEEYAAVRFIRVVYDFELEQNQAIGFNIPTEATGADAINSGTATAAFLWGYLG